MIFFRAIIIVFFLLAAACSGENRPTSGPDAAAVAAASTLVVASNYPLFFFAARITEGVDVAPEIVLPNIEGDPTFWIPDAEQIQLLQSAAIVLLNGAGAEPWLDLMSIDQRRLLNTSASIADRLIPLEDTVAHQHGPEGEHSHQGTAFTTWLDPQLAIAQAQAVTSALNQLAPSGETGFQNNLAKLEQELTQLDSQLAEVLMKLDGRPVLFSHPVYQYLQRRFGINGQSLHWEPDQSPTTSNWIAMQQLLATHPATIMIWEDEPLVSTSRRLSEMGITSVAFKTVANRPGAGEYMSTMRDNAERLESGISPGKL